VDFRASKYKSLECPSYPKASAAEKLLWSGHETHSRWPQGIMHTSGGRVFTALSPQSIMPIEMRPSRLSYARPRSSYVQAPLLYLWVAIPLILLASRLLPCLPCSY